jgi:hypothetical protein
MHRLVAWLTVPLLAASLVACSSDSSRSGSSQGSSPGDSSGTNNAGTDGTGAGDTAAPGGDGQAFGGAPCTALTGDDFAAVTFEGFGTPTLQSADPLEGGACQYVVTFPAGQELVIAMSLSDQSAFDNAGEGAFATEGLDGIGLRAVGIDQPGVYTILVETEHGYFELTGLSKDGTMQLAAAAAGRA